jgi:hypothetical protein
MTYPEYGKDVCERSEDFSGVVFRAATRVKNTKERIISDYELKKFNTSNELGTLNLLR